MKNAFGPAFNNDRQSCFVAQRRNWTVSDEQKHLVQIAVDLEKSINHIHKVPCELLGSVGFCERPTWVGLHASHFNKFRKRYTERPRKCCEGQV